MTVYADLPSSVVSPKRHKQLEFRRTTRSKVQGSRVEDSISKIHSCFLHGFKILDPNLAVK